MRRGQKTTGRAHVKKQISLDDYIDMLSGFSLVEEQDAYSPVKKHGGNYFEGVWKVID
jgi:hypothetical protein